jgi:hypothetical protein
VPSLGAGEKARAAAQSAAEATTLAVPYSVAKTLTPQQQTDLRADIGGWDASLQLPPSISQTVLSRISSEGPKVSVMSPEDRAAWVAQQDKMLLGVAAETKHSSINGKKLPQSWLAAPSTTPAIPRFCWTLTSRII